MAGLLLAALMTFSACDGGLFRKKKEYYECTVAFYVNPEMGDEGIADENYGVYGPYSVQVLDNMVKLLSAAEFTEYLMLNGEKVPEFGVWTGENGEDVSNEVNSGIRVANTEMEYVNELYFEISIEQEVARTSSQELREVWYSEMRENDEVDSAYWQYSENAYKTLYSQGKVSVAIQAAYSDYIACQEALNTVKDTADSAALEAEEKIAQALAPWRATNEYKTQFNNYSKGITYSYQNATGDDNLERSFLYAEISVLENESLAAKLLSRILSHLPAYVQENMAVSSEYIGTRCVAISNLHEITMVKR